MEVMNTAAFHGTKVVAGIVARACSFSCSIHGKPTVIFIASSPLLTHPLHLLLAGEQTRGLGQHSGHEREVQAGGEQVVAVVLPHERSRQDPLLLYLFAGGFHKGMFTNERILRYFDIGEKTGAKRRNGRKKHKLRTNSWIKVLPVLALKPSRGAKEYISNPKRLVAKTPNTVSLGLARLPFEDLTIKKHKRERQVLSLHSTHL